MCLIKKVKTLFILLLFVLNFQNLNALENRILFKVDNEIITTIDIYEEINFLKAFNPEINNLDEKELIEISKNSILRNTIKKIELKKVVEEFKVDDKFLLNLIISKYSKIGLEIEVSIEENNFKCEVVEKPFFDPKKKITSKSL